MAIINSKRKINFNGGGNKYRQPLVYSGRRIKNKNPKEIRLPKIVWKAFAFLIIIFIVVYLIFFSSYFQIRDVIVQGTNLVPSEQIKKYVPDGSNIFLFNVAKTKSRILQENSEIKNLEIIRGIPNAVKIVILEHDNKLIWESNGEQYLVSSQGRVTKRIKEGELFEYPKIIDSKNIPVKLGENIVSPSFISFVTNINNNLFSLTNLKPIRYEVPETTFDLNLYTDLGFYIKLNTIRSSNKQLDNLKRVLVNKKSDIKEYVDLRIDGLAYYK